MKEKIISSENKTGDFIVSDKNPALIFVPLKCNYAIISSKIEKKFQINAELGYLGVTETYSNAFDGIGNYDFPILEQFTGYESLTVRSERLAEDTTLNIQFFFIYKEVKTSS